MVQNLQQRWDSKNPQFITTVFLTPSPSLYATANRGEQSGGHVVETCIKLAEVRGGVEKDEYCIVLYLLPVLNPKSYGIGKKDEMEEPKGEKMENFFCSVYDFLTDASFFLYFLSYVL